MAGFRVLWASEFVDAARDSYLANFPETHIDSRDIRLIKPEEILAAVGMAAGEVDVMEGSPPCASFSTAGKREKHWGAVKTYSETAQRTDDLFFEFARILAGVRPKAFVAENVSGLVKGVAKGYFKEILAALRACGYDVRARLLDAQWLGVPQMRQRIIFVGAREDLGVAPRFPTPLSYRYSIRDALPWLDGMRLGPHGYYPGRVVDGGEPSPQVEGEGMGSYSYEITGRTGPGFERVASEIDRPMNTIGATDDEQTRCELSLREGRAASVDEPAPTVQTHGNRFTRSEMRLAAIRLRDGNSRKKLSEPTSSEDERVYSADGPAPAVGAEGIGGAFAHQAGIVGEPEPSELIVDRYRPGGAPSRERRLSTDDPAPTVSAKRMATGFIGQVGIVGRSSPTRTFERDLNDVAPTVQAMGIGDVKSYQAGVEIRGGTTMPYGKGEPIALDEPIPTVLGGVAQKDMSRQFVITQGNAAPFDKKGAPVSLDEPIPTVMCGNEISAGHHFKIEGDAPSLEGTAVGREWDHLKKGESSDRYFNLVKPDASEPVPTVTASGGSSAGIAAVTHPVEKRKFAIAELKRLCGFPDDFALTGTYAQQWERLGRAVPPPMMAAIARSVREMLDAARARERQRA